MFKKIIKFLLTELIFNGHLQSLGAVGIVYLSSLTFKITPPWHLLVVTYLNFQIIYYYDRFKDIKSDSKTNVTRTIHLKKFLNKIPQVMFIFVSILIYLTLKFSNIFALFVFLFVLVMGILYPIYFRKLTKKIFAFKNLYVSAVHAFLVFYPLIYFSQKTISNNILILILYIFIEAMIAQALLDMKDVLSDKKEKMLTIPNVFGTNKTFIYVEALSIISPFIFIPSNYFYIALLTLFVNLTAIHFIKKKQKIGFILEAAKFSLWLPLLFIFLYYN